MVRLSAATASCPPRRPPRALAQRRQAGRLLVASDCTRFVCSLARAVSAGPAMPRVVQCKKPVLESHYTKDEGGCRGLPAVPGVRRAGGAGWDGAARHITASGYAFGSRGYGSDTILWRWSTCGAHTCRASLSDYVRECVCWVNRLSLEASLTHDGLLFAGKIHAEGECWENYKISKAPKCIVCDGPVMGSFYPVDEGKVNSAPLFPVLRIQCFENSRGVQSLA